MRVLVVAAVLGPLAAACSDPTFDVSIEYEELAGAAASDQLAPHVATLTVSVIDGVAAGPAAGLGRDASCDDIAYGRIPEDVLEGARRASVGALDTPHLSGVPRLGLKLVFAEARNASGRRVGAGCSEVGDIESDTTVNVVVEVAPRMRVFTREDIAAAPSEVQLLVTAPWDDALPVPDRKIVAELYEASNGPPAATDVTTNADGLALVQGLEASVPGPAQTVIRVPWAEDLLRVPAFVQWPAMAVMGSTMPHISLGANDLARLSRSWVSGVSTVNGVTAWGAAALQKPIAQAEEVVVVRYNSGANKLVAVNVPTPGARALGLWDRKLYTITDGGWNEITGSGLAPVPGSTASGAGPATEIQVFDGCDNAPGAGMLVRRLNSSAPDAVEELYAYSEPGVLAPAGHPLATLAAALDPANDEIIGQACANLGDQVVRIVATRGNAVGIVAWLPTGQRVTLPGIQDATGFQRNGVWFLAAVEGAITGPRVASHKLTTLSILGNSVTGFVSVEGVDSELATLPLALAVADVDDDDLYDVLAALPGLAGPRIQANFGRLVAGEQLASISPALDGGRAATNPILKLEDVDGSGHKELVVMTDEGLDVLCFDVRNGANGMQCAPP